MANLANLNTQKFYKDNKFSMCVCILNIYYYINNIIWSPKPKFLIPPQLGAKFTIPDP